MRCQCYCCMLELVHGTLTQSDLQMFSSSDNLPGAIPVQIIASLQKGRPAGTSWILPGGSQVDVTTAKTENQLDDEKGAFVYSPTASNSSVVPTLTF